MAAQRLQQKNLDSPDETRTFENGKTQVVTLGDFTASRLVLEPGWRWSENVKPIAGTDTCQVLHTGYHVSGRLHVRLEDGTEKEYGPGDAYVIPPGHDAWVVGDEPVVTVDMSRATAEHYAKKVTDTVGGVTEPVRGVTDTVGGTVSGTTDSVRGVTDKLLGGEEKQQR
jgi:quercetin dioxygenase-like cupin family protein